MRMNSKGIVIQDLTTRQLWYALLCTLLSALVCSCSSFRGLCPGSEDRRRSLLVRKQSMMRCTAAAFTEKHLTPNNHATGLDAEQRLEQKKINTHEQEAICEEDSKRSRHIPMIETVSGYDLAIKKPLSTTKICTGLQAPTITKS